MSAHNDIRHPRPPRSSLNKETKELADRGKTPSLLPEERKLPSIPAVRIANLKQVYLAADPLVALDNVSFDVWEREFIVLVGPSGCGKTTALKVIAGLVPPTSGEVSVFGQPVKGPTAGVGMVFQTPVLLKWRTVIDNVLFPIDILRLSRKKFRQPALDLLRLVGLHGFEDRYPSQLSGGMQQRVAIARALIHDPTLLLMDEPFGALDQMTRGHMNVELLRIWDASRKTSILITHSITEAVFLADRVIVMTSRPGTVAGIVDIDLPRPRLPELHLKPSFMKKVEEVGRLIGLEFL